MPQENILGPTLTARLSPDQHTIVNNNYEQLFGQPFDPAAPRISHKEAFNILFSKAWQYSQGKQSATETVRYTHDPRQQQEIDRLQTELNNLQSLHTETLATLAAVTQERDTHYRQLQELSVQPATDPPAVNPGQLLIQFHPADIVILESIAKAMSEGNNTFTPETLLVRIARDSYTDGAMYPGKYKTLSKATVKRVFEQYQ